MKTCKCGGKLYRHGQSEVAPGERYRCIACQKTITVRNGEIVAKKTGRPMKQDWRHGESE